MNNKKNLLVLLLTISASALLIAEDDTVATTTNNKNITSTENVTSASQSMPQPAVSFNSKTLPQESESLLEQRFICEQEGQEGGVVCQMYECLNEDCHAATAIKTDDATIVIPEKEFTAQENPSFDFNESEIACPVITPEDLSAEALAKEEEEMAEFDLQKTAPSKLDIMSDIDVPSRDNGRVQQLKREINNEKQKCERAESDPREKAICEDAGAEVQWRKERIKTLENR
jgi:hypothetical protein